MTIRAFALLLSFVFAASAARAERAISVEPYVGAPDGGAIVLPVRGGAVLSGAVEDVNERANGGLARAISDAGFDGEEGDKLTLYGIRPFTRIDLIGVGSDEIDRTTLEDFGARAAGLLEDSDETPAEILWTLESSPNAAAHIAFGAALGQYSFDTYKSDVEDAAIEALIVRTPTADAAGPAWEGDWRHMAEAVSFGRDLASEPPNVLYPESFVERARQAFRGVDNVDVRVLDVRAMERLNMGALLGVGQGSVRPPRLLVISYNGDADGEAPVALAGKGITFDTGGLSLKPGTSMLTMKGDMTGAATVVSTVLAIAKRGADVNVVAIAALAENMPSSTAQRPSDVVRTMSGKTIEIISTDAEGRLVLADAVYYAQQEFEPAVLINVATLTGSVVRALSDEYAGLFSRHDSLADDLIAAGKTSGEELWRLPLHPNYYDQISSPIADIKNSGAGNPGAGVGAAVIGTFVDEDVVWAHLDIAGNDHRSSSDALPTAPSGYTAYGVRLLDQYIRVHHEGR